MKKCYLITFFSMLLLTFSVFAQSIDNEPCVSNQWGWAVSVQTSDDNNFNSSVHADLSGNLYVAGLITDQVTLGDTTYHNTGGSDGYLAKYTPTGVLLWSAHVIISGYGSHFRITTDAYDNVYISGNFTDTLTVDGSNVISNNGSSDLFVIKYNLNKELQWVKRFGGSDSDALGDITADHLGNVILSGNFAGSTDIEGSLLSSTNGHDFLFKINDAGIVDWVEQFGDSYNWGTSVSIKTNNNIVVSGIYSGLFEIQGSFLQNPASPSAPEADAAFLAEFSVNGNLIWLKQANTGSNSKVVLELDKTDAIYLGGNFFDGGFIVGDSTHTGPAAYIAKYNPSGEAQWSRQIGDFYFNWVSGIAVDATNNIFVNGLLTSAMSFGGQPHQGNGGFMAKYSPDGDELKLWSTGDFTYDRADFLTSDPEGNIYCSGVFSGSLLLGEHLVTAEEGEADIYIAKMKNGSPLFPAEPVVATSKISFSNLNNGSVDLSWTNGDGTARIIIARKMGKVSVNEILDGASYNDGGGLFGNGSQTGNKQYVVYNGTGNFATVSGLEPNKVYSFMALEYSKDAGCPNSANYKTTQNKITYLTIPGSRLASQNLVVSPNPVDENMNVTLTTKTRGEKKLVLMDRVGRPVQNFYIDVTEEVSQTSVDLSAYNLKPGIYYLKYKNDDESDVFKMIKR